MGFKTECVLTERQMMLSELMIDFIITYYLNRRKQITSTTEMVRELDIIMSSIFNIQIDINLDGENNLIIFSPELLSGPIIKEIK